MTRAELRRRQKAKDKDPVYHIRKSEIDKMVQAEVERWLKEDKEKAVVEACDRALVHLFSVPIMVLAKDYGWGTRKRLPEFAERLTDAYQEIVEGDKTLMDYADMVYRMTGVKFEQGD